MKRKKYLPPLIIGGIILIYLFIIIMVLLYAPWEENELLMIPTIAFIFAMNGVTVYVVYERIIEIKGGEEDDLSKY